MKVKITSHCSKFSLLLNCLLFSVQFSFAQTPASSNLSKSVLACNLPPIITCPSNITVSPGASSDPAAFGCAKALPGAVGCNQPIVSHQQDLVLVKKLSNVFGLLLIPKTLL